MFQIFSNGVNHKSMEHWERASIHLPCYLGRLTVIIRKPNFQWLKMKSLSFSLYRAWGCGHCSKVSLALTCSSWLHDNYHSPSYFICDPDRKVGRVGRYHHFNQNLEGKKCFHLQHGGSYRHTLLQDCLGNQIPGSLMVILIVSGSWSFYSI